ncbi:acyltransferase-domain-containing protein [Peziza echinospora]|nr:acyltransferase-domain-containing protein [Peziza echinospora]
MGLNESQTDETARKPGTQMKVDLNEAHPAGHVQYGSIRQYIRMLSFGLYFQLSMFIIFFTQCVGAPSYFFSKQFYYAWMARTKAHFGVLVTTITQWWSPTIIRVTGDKTVRDQIRIGKDGTLECDFPERIILIANHQLYSDWLYLWWIAYTAKMHGFLYIILKESLKYIPVVGQGMLFYGFIFLARKWEQDKPRFLHRINKLNAQADEPMWLLIFPEGTNASENGRRTSTKFAEKIGIQDLKHTLLPRTTGLTCCIQNLRKTTEWMYDCTMAYEGIPEGKFGQDYFTLYSTYFEGRPPKSVNMYFRRFKLVDIPVDNEEEFTIWLRARWVEKDNLVDFYVKYGRFPDDDELDQAIAPTPLNGNAFPTDGSGELRRRTIAPSSSPIEINGETKFDDVERKSKSVETEVKLRNTWEVFDIFSTLLVVGLLGHIGNTIFKLVTKIAIPTTAVGLPEPAELL